SEVNNSLVDSPLPDQRVAKIIFGHVIVPSNGQSVRPKTEIVVPIPNLIASNGGEREQAGECGCGQILHRELMGASPLRGSPNNHYEKADQRQITIAIGHGLV